MGANPVKPSRIATPTLWVGALLALLVGEILYVTFRYDTGVILHTAGWWATLLGTAPYALQIAIAVVVANVLFMGSRLGNPLSGFSTRDFAPARGAVFFCSDTASRTSSSYRSAPNF